MLDACVCVRASDIKNVVIEPIDASVQEEPQSETKETVKEYMQDTVIVAKTDCKEGMVEVEGEYCNNIDHKCLEWRDKDTQKVCINYEKGYAKCLGGTKHMHFCVDQYEIPNIKDQRPTLGMSFYDVDNFCRTQGKRMGTDQEWTLAAEGNERSPYPHSWERSENWCAWDKPYIVPDWNKLYQNGEIRYNELKRLDQSDPSGSHPNCYTEWNGKRVYDMQANGDEWTINVSLGGRPYVGLLKGGYFSKGLVRNRARPYTESHGPTFNGYEVSGRCFMDIK